MNSVLYDAKSRIINDFHVWKGVRTLGGHPTDTVI